MGSPFLGPSPGPCGPGPQARKRASTIVPVRAPGFAGSIMCESADSLVSLAAPAPARISACFVCQGQRAYSGVLRLFLGFAYYLESIFCLFSRKAEGAAFQRPPT